MQDRATRIVMLVVAVLLAILVLQPYVNTYLFSAREPRPVAARGDLADLERTTIKVFETVAPSVVQVVALQGRGPAGGEPAGSGTGFLWDNAGHVVTNDHVVANGSSFVVRLASGEVLPAEVVGRAPNYDLAVLRVQRQGGLPAPVHRRKLGRSEGRARRPSPSATRSASTSRSPPASSARSSAACRPAAGARSPT